jgi:hypothetical protein
MAKSHLVVVRASSTESSPYSHPHQRLQAHGALPLLVITAVVP